MQVELASSWFQQVNGCKHTWIVETAQKNHLFNRHAVTLWFIFPKRCVLLVEISRNQKRNVRTPHLTFDSSVVEHEVPILPLRHPPFLVRTLPMNLSPYHYDVGSFMTVDATWLEMGTEQLSQLTKHQAKTRVCELQTDRLDGSRYGTMRMAMECTGPVCTTWI